MWRPTPKTPYPQSLLGNTLALIIKQILTFRKWRIIVRKHQVRYNRATMNLATNNRLRMNHISTIAGGLVWLLLFLFLPAVPQTTALMTRLLLLAVLVNAFGLVLCGLLAWTLEMPGAMQ